MARDRRGRIVYNNDATVIEETSSVEVKQRPDVVAPRRASERKVRISDDDLVFAFASYTQFKFNKGDGVGKCLICGNPTQFDIRKICVNCMKKYSEQIIDEVMEGFDVADRTITLNIVE